MRTLIVIPAYNEEESITKVVEEITRKCPDCDYLVVNDCSTDTTPEILDSNRFNHVDLCSNLGIGGGVQSGFIYAMNNGYDCMVQIDGDGQHDPAYVAGLIRPIEDDEADVVIGSRFLDRQGFQSSGMRRFGIRFLSGLIRMVTFEKIKDVTSGFRAYNKTFIRYFAGNYADDYPEPEAIVFAKAKGARIKEVPVIMRSRDGGTSSISPFKSMYYMIKVSIAVLLTKFIVKGKK